MTDPPTPEAREPLRTNRRGLGVGVLAAVAVGASARAATDDPHPFGRESPGAPRSYGIFLPPVFAAGKIRWRSTPTARMH